MAGAKKIFLIIKNQELEKFKEQLEKKRSKVKVALSRGITESVEKTTIFWKHLMLKTKKMDRVTEKDVENAYYQYGSILRT